MKRPKRVLLDTSTLFSGLGWSGPPFRVHLKIHEENFDLILTDYILDELSNHLKDYPEDRREKAIQSLEYLREASIILEGTWEKNLKKAEKLVGETKDAPIMAAYLHKDVDILVTSNIKDFPTQKHENILTPKKFLKKF